MPFADMQLMRGGSWTPQCKFLTGPMGIYAPYCICLPPCQITIGWREPSMIALPVIPRLQNLAI